MEKQDISAVEKIIINRFKKLTPDFWTFILHTNIRRVACIHGTCIIKVCFHVCGIVFSEYEIKISISIHHY